MSIQGKQLTMIKSYDLFFYIIKLKSKFNFNLPKRMNQKPTGQNITVLNNISREISNLLISRKKIVQNCLANTINARPQVTDHYNREIISHCNQYSQIKRFVQDFSRNHGHYKQLSDQSGQFWETNQKTERDLQKRLKNLKEIDSHIDQLIQEEIDMAKQIEEIEQRIRGILNKKQYDHINKAEPLYTKKQATIRNLQQIKRQKEGIKEQKLSELHNILQILYQMKNLRKRRMEECKQTSFSKQSMTLLECLSKDIDQLIINKKNQLTHDNNQKKMFTLVTQTNQKINKLTKQLNEMFQTQVKAFEQINQIFRVKSELGYFHQRILSFFQTSEQQLFGGNQKFSHFIESQTQKSTQLSQVVQGITTTEDTIEIFENLQHNLETQTLRRKQLLQKITRLNKAHAIQKERKQAINEKQARMQGFKINYSKLEVMLSEAAEQADVKGYKVVHSQIDDLSRHIKLQMTELQKIKMAKRESAKRIYQQTTNIQEEYRDLISQMFPQIWFRDNDFSKEQTIADFDVYLGKLFSRLKILT